MFRSSDKPLRWMIDTLTTPPLGRIARIEAGDLLRRLQRAEMLAMPASRPMPRIGRGVHELRVADRRRRWTGESSIESTWMPFWSSTGSRRDLGSHLAASSISASAASRGTTVVKKKLPKGWTEGSVQELLGLADDEAEIVEMRVRLAQKVREKRRARGLTQRELAERIRSTQPRVARMEQAGASLEMLIQALFALGASRKEIGRVLAA
jgi:hypothetical protein